MTEILEPESRRGPDSLKGHDLRSWQFREMWRSDDTSTVLIWVDGNGAVLHERSCLTVPDAEPIGKCRMDQARALFEVERPKGNHRYFGFCGNCLSERVPNYGWRPSERGLLQISGIRTHFNDVRILGEQPISRAELIRRMMRYTAGAPALKDLNRLIDYYRQNHPEEEEDLTTFLRDG